MIKRIIATCVSMLSLTAIAKPITLTESNFVLLKGEITGMSVAKTILEVEQLNTDTPTIYIQSPGGSVVAGMQFIQYMKDSGKKFTCIADVAISMAFSILQACDTRLVMTSSTLMQHQVSFTLQGPAENVKTQYKYILDMTEEMEIMEAKRIGISLAKFKADRLSDLWLTGHKAVDYGAADKIEVVKCAPELYETVVTVTEIEFIFKIDVDYSSCPLVRAPVGITPQGNVPEDKVKSLTDRLGSN